MEPQRFPGGKMKPGRELQPGPQTVAVAIERLRFALLLSLTATVGWLLVAAYFDASPRATVAFSNASLCIHRPGS